MKTFALVLGIVTSVIFFGAASNAYACNVHGSNAAAELRSLFSGLEGFTATNWSGDSGGHSFVVRAPNGVDRIFSYSDVGGASDFLWNNLGQQNHTTTEEYQG